MRRFSLTIVAFAMLLSACDALQYTALKTYMAVEKGVEVADGDELIHSPDQDFVLRALTDELEFPWGMAFLPNGQLLVTEKPGRLRLLDTITGENWLIQGTPEVYYQGQGGLLGVAVHPRFAETGWIYLSAAMALDDELRTTRVFRYRLRDRQLSQEKLIFEATPAGQSSNHFGGAMLFDNAGLLYITMGDRKMRHRAQDLDSSLGKILRLQDDGSIPANNPFVDTYGALPEIYSYGHRNPQGIAIDRATGRIWNAEHGPQGGDEINLLEAGTNYGWPIITYGEEYGGGKIGEGTHKDGMRQPIIHYVPSIATAGLAYYDGAALPGWTGSLFVAGLRSFSMSRVWPDGDGQIREQRLLEDRSLRFRGVAQGPDDNLYIATENGGVLRLSPAPTGEPPR